MKTKTFLKGLLALFLFTTTFCFAAESKIDKLVKEKDFQTLTKLIKETKIVENEMQIPLESKDNDLIIIENEYDVKVLFEYLNGNWNEKTGTEIAAILNDQKSTYMHLFNYKVNDKAFDPYVSDKESVKVTDEDKKVYVKILDSKFNDKAINSTIKVFTQKQLIPTDDIINIQIVNIHSKGEETNCQIIFTYKE